MKKTLSLCAMIATTLIAAGQNEHPPVPIRTAVPFLTIAPDAISAGMAGVGTASLPDVYSQHHNTAKYAFTPQKMGVGVSYVPWLKNITGDMFLGYVNFYSHIGRTSSIGTSLRIFSLGGIQMNDYQGGQIIPLGKYNPTEMALDVSYSMQLSPRLSMGVALRYTRSDISERSDPSTDDFHAGNALSADISLYYKSKVYELKKNKISYTLGLNIRDIGSKMDYGKDINQGYEYMPTHLSLGAACHLLGGQKNTFSLMLQTDKMLVPTPVWDDEQGCYITPDKGILGGMWNALVYAPNGSGEKLSEYTFSLGGQWDYDSRWALRCGYHYGNAEKGEWQYASIGASGRLGRWRADIAYTIPIGNKGGENPFGNSLRIGLCIDLGRESKN